MRLKPIKPGMVIHCKDEAELTELLKEAERLGYVWYDSKQKPTEKLNCEGNTIHFYNKEKRYDYKHIIWSDNTEGVTEFSDLILPELTPDETLRAFGEICTCVGCSRCPFDSIKGDSDCPTFLIEHYKEAVEICAQWKSDHAKKEPEIETVDICRIIEIQPDGRKRCVHEEDIKPDPELPYGSEEIAVHEILKRYCMEHDGEFIAVHETVSRVKAVE